MSDTRDTLDIDDVAGGHPVSEAELATLRADLARTTEKAEADLARVTAERDALASIVGEAIVVTSLGYDEEAARPSGHALIDAVLELRARGSSWWMRSRQTERERDAARAQVRELQKVARAAVQLVRGSWAPVKWPEAIDGVRRAVDALPPSMLEEPSDG